MASPLYSGFGTSRPPVARRSPFGSSVAVGQDTRAYREQQAHTPAGATPAAAAAPTWTPPPLGTYDPARDVEIGSAERGLGQLTDELGTSRTRDTSDYLLRRGEIEKAQGREGEDYGRAKAALDRSYANLGVRQGERANQYGVLGGGALLQSAAKRAANQAIQQQTADVGHTRAGEGFTQQLAQLALQLAPPDAANPTGGREFQDLATKLTNAQANESFYTLGQQKLEDAEATANGYRPAEPAVSRPKAPPPRKAPLSRHPFARYRNGF